MNDLVPTALGHLLSWDQALPLIEALQAICQTSLDLESVEIAERALRSVARNNPEAVRADADGHLPAASPC
jgi:hypothetical protein